MKGSNELALNRDPSTGFVPWIVATLSLVATLTLAVAFSSSNLVSQWQQRQQGEISVRLADVTAETAQNAEIVRNRLANTPGIASVTQVPRHQVQQLLAPWLGIGNDKSVASLLPLPYIFDVQTDVGAQISADALTDALADIPGIAVDDGERWLKPVAHLAQIIGTIAFALALLAIMSVAFVTTFATRAALAAQFRTVELLQIIGAENTYIARQFQRHSLLIAGKGALAGVAIGIIAVLIALRVVPDGGTALLAGVGPGIAGWIMMACLPAIAGLVAMVTARVTVLKQLRLDGGF